ncbi:MAG: HEAT repeat domain-containing protein, partial [Anaerolineales bacterium]
MLNFRLDQLSFWIGFAAATFFWWLFRQARPAFSLLRKVTRERASAVRAGLSVGTEQRYRQEVVGLFAQEHLAAPLFTLEEIAVAPKLILPPPPVVPGDVLPPESITDIAIPYLPDVPEVGSHFQVKAISFPEAMSAGGNLLVMGPAGSGRSFALHHLATQVARRHPDTGALGALVPICFHAGALDMGNTKKPLDALYQLYAERLSMMAEASLMDFFEEVLQSSRALILVDGLDDLPEIERKEVVAFLENLQQEYPGNRYVVVTSPQDLSPQEPLKLFTFAISGWEDEQKNAFIQQWSDLWMEHIPAQSWSSELPEIYDPLILNTWLKEDTALISPFHLTLMIWAAYAGDSRGPGELDALEAYLWRMSEGIKNARPALENLAAQSVLNQASFLTHRDANSYIAQFEEVPESELEAEETGEEMPLEAEIPLKEQAAASGLDVDDLDALLDELEDLDPEVVVEELGDEAVEYDLDELSEETPEDKERDTGRLGGFRLIPQMTEARLLTLHPNGRYSFIHPIFAGYLAAAVLTGAEHAHILNQQPDWNGKTLTQQYLPAAGAEMTPFIASAVQHSQEDPTQSALALSGSWLRYAHKTTQWRNKFMRTLAKMLRDESLSLTLRTKIVAQLAFTQEAGINSLFSQMLESSKHSVRWLGVLGSGLTMNTNTIETLGGLLFDTSIFVSRAACLSLVKIGTNRALELVTTALLEANDEVRRAAAEALAQHPAEGYPVLKDGTTFEDVQVRRAVVFGLARIHEPWAEEIIATIQTEDEQWVVRNAAIQMIEDQKLAKAALPKDLPPIHEMPWLIAFAGE